MMSRLGVWLRGVAVICDGNFPRCGGFGHGGVFSGGGAAEDTGVTATEKGLGAWREGSGKM